MGIWSAWLDLIGSIVTALADAGLGLGCGIVVATVLLRIALLPLAWPMAYRACIRQKKLAMLQPELRALQERFRDRPEVSVRKLTELYKANGLTMVDAKALLGSLAQLPLFLGMFQVLRDIGAGARFLWVPNLLRPDVVLAVIAGLTTAVMTAVMISMSPDMPEQLRILMVVLPSVIAIVAALQFSSAVAIYWATSNTFSALQTLALHAVVRRRARSGAINI